MAGGPFQPDHAHVSRAARVHDPAATVAVAACDLLLAQALGHVMTTAGLHVVACLATFEALLEKIRCCRPTLAVVDADLREDPLEADGFVARQRAAGPHTRLIVLTAEVDVALAHAVVAHDVRAVILKSTPAADALAVVWQVLHDRTSFPAAVLARLDAPEVPAMSARQLEVLEQLALGRSNREIACQLYISVNTVKFHLQAIYGRLGVRNRVEAAAALKTQRGRVSGPSS